jgi:hypothetical protein
MASGAVKTSERVLAAVASIGFLWPIFFGKSFPSWVQHPSWPNITASVAEWLSIAVGVGCLAWLSRDLWSSRYKRLENANKLILQDDVQPEIRQWYRTYGDNAMQSALKLLDDMEYDIEGYRIEKKNDAYELAYELIHCVKNGAYRADWLFSQALGDQSSNSLRGLLNWSYEYSKVVESIAECSKHIDGGIKDNAKFSTWQQRHDNMFDAANKMLADDKFNAVRSKVQNRLSSNKYTFA